MADPRTHRAEHRVTVRAPAEKVYELIADVTAWPRVFPPTVHVQRLETDGAAERITIWATANDTVKSWTSRRELDRAGLRISFRQEVSQPPVAEMGGRWEIEPLPGGESLVRLHHDYRAVGDDPDGAEWIARAVDRNSEAELAALKQVAEREAAQDRLLLVFADSVEIAGSARDVFDFVDQAQHWAERLPHVARVSLREVQPHVQVLGLDTRTAKGDLHTTESVRVTFPHRSIVYKQQVLPALLSVHNGRWTFAEHDGRTTATSEHTVVIKEEAIASVLGEDADVETARAWVQRALSGNSLATLEHAKKYAESAVGAAS
ncbi:aromatase/cyclase [Nonomuraea jabiensis]|uniref:Ribosome-associated toxin RatA of RatAB toxin-antitoxin module n=1 Tax=Nonomuraea jabiensis TaxID=882448 RepID=A0A7W9GG98_9ACTN|nr:aromatase/cyclase [Nonomuraea jabiensis]MBB5783202.1 ribosome-associated toxin RatA of RatAB toxin-antitoxin module [Nonomuraea jabiensis]